jgi:hypothetical protein
MRPHLPASVRGVLAAIVLAMALAPQPGHAAACDDGSRQPRRITGSYVPAGEPYARSFVFAMLVDCKGSKEVVTVQRATGNLPVCGSGQEVELTGTLVLSKYLVDAHYEIKDPTDVTCRTVAQAPTSPAPTSPVPAKPPAVTAQATPSTPAPPPASAPVPPTPAPTPLPASRAITPAVWLGRYQDSRGAGTVTVTLVRGASTVSGTWRLRTGGGGPLTGLIEGDGRRIQLRMENVAPDCPGVLEGTGEITATTLIASYQGKDCEGSITGGRLELQAQAANP